MTDDAKLQAFYEEFGLDEFQRIAVNELSRQLDQFGNATPQPGSEHERLLTQLGEVIAERMLP